MDSKLILRFCTSRIGRLAAVVVLSGWACAQHSDEQQPSFYIDNTTVLRAITTVGAQEHIPIGIVLDGSKNLCQATKPLTTTSMTADRLIATLLAGSNSVSTTTKEVIEVKPRTLSPMGRRILTMTWSRFNGMSTTIQGLGNILSGYIGARLHPQQSYAGNILSSLDAEHLPAFTLSNVSMEEIANHLVSLGSKGVWILYLPADLKNASDNRVIFKTFGYKDDMYALGRVSCRP